MADLPVWNTAASAYRFVWSERRHLWNLMLPAVIVLALLSAVVEWGSATKFSGDLEHLTFSTRLNESPGIGLLWIAAFLNNVWIWLSYSVAWHRIYLKPGENMTIADAYKLSGRQMRFLWTIIKVWLLLLPSLFIMPFFAALSLPGILLMILGIAVYFYVYARLFLWLPATALDHRYTFGEIWKLSEGYGWRLLGIVILTSIPIGIVTLILAFVLAAIIVFVSPEQGLTAGLIKNIVFEIVSFCGVAVGVSAYSISYQILVESKSPSPVT